MGGGGVGYAATGTMDGALMGASMGQAIGGAFGNFAVACFTAGTPLVVDREGNSRPIDEIEVGDFVLARSEFDPDGPLELKRVEEKFVRTAVVMEMVVHGQSIKTTAEHPFFVPAQGKFVAAGELQVGEQLVGHARKLVQIASIGSTGEVTKVYNLRVADFHTYFVGGTIWGWDVWVHNASGIYSGDYGNLKASKKRGLAGGSNGEEIDHLNQHKAYGFTPTIAGNTGRAIPRRAGAATPLLGSIKSGFSHSIKHQSLEQFWNAARSRFRKTGIAPTNQEYGSALYNSLRDAGLSPRDAFQLSNSAQRQRVSYGHFDADPVPNIPNPIPKGFLP